MAAIRRNYPDQRPVLLNEFPLHGVPDSNVHGAIVGPIWVLSVPDGPHVGPMNLAIRGPHKFAFCLRITAKRRAYALGTASSCLSRNLLIVSLDRERVSLIRLNDTRMAVRFLVILPVVSMMSIRVYDRQRKLVDYRWLSAKLLTYWSYYSLALS